jgi:hypothetical protein
MSRIELEMEQMALFLETCCAVFVGVTYPLFLFATSCLCTRRSYFIQCNIDHAARRYRSRWGRCPLGEWGD